MNCRLLLSSLTCLTTAGVGWSFTEAGAKQFPRQGAQLVRREVGSSNRVAHSNGFGSFPIDGERFGSGSTIPFQILSTDTMIAEAPSHDLPKRFDDLSRKSEQRKRESLKKTLLWQGYDLKQDPPWRPFSHEQGLVKSVFTEPIKLVLGLMTIADHREIREAHRRTWMRQGGVCTVDRWNDSNCHVFVVFVFGNVSHDQFASEADSLILTGVPEPERLESLSGYEGDGGYDNKGKSRRMWLLSQFKTPAFFSYALHNLAWATHIGKLDEDTFPYVGDVLQDLVELAKHGLHPTYYGKSFVGGYHGKQGMFGEFYVLSVDAVECAAKAERKMARQVDSTTNTSWGEDWFKHAEDQVVGELLYLAEESKECLPILKASVEDRWLHPV
jgi:hypothetical protein|eukprot:TRINITY_DN19276_c0_g1_i1.p1 TRINITY_DN19276_c0_g1~~TRINITY_DN19276_c0_g1_i1.p1  ORF type:complete len:385 (-),score=46.82 TRINITY_DN19276_c0_g1_i1:88-1242(-)